MMANSFYVPLPAARAPKSLDFSGLNEGIDAIGKANRQSKVDADNAMFRGRADARAEAYAGRQEKQFNIANEDRKRNVLATLTQSVLDAPPDQRSALIDTWRRTDPELDADMQKHGLDFAQIDQWGPTFISRARGLQDPQKQRQAEANIAKTEAQAKRAGYLTAGGSIFQIGGQGSGNGSLDPVFTAPKSQYDILKEQTLSEDIKRKTADRERGYMTKSDATQWAAAKRAGFSDEIAALFVSGGIKVETDPITRRKRYTDFMGNELSETQLRGQGGPPGGFPGMQPQGQAQPIPVGGPATVGQQAQSYQPPDLPEIDPQNTLWARAPLMTGFATSLGETITKIPAAGTQDPATRDAKSDFDVAQRKIKSVFALSRRFPVHEMKIVEDLFGRGYLTKPEVLQSSLASLDDMIADELKEQTRVANDQSMPVEDRRNAIHFINSAQSLRKMLGVPKKMKSMEEAMQLPPGTVFRTPDGRIKVRP